MLLCTCCGVHAVVHMLWCKCCGVSAVVSVPTGVSQLQGPKPLPLGVATVLMKAEAACGDYTTQSIEKQTP